MKQCIQTITWRFKDTSETYPQLKKKQIQITSPSEMYEQFKFLFLGEVKEKFLVFWLSSSNSVMGFEEISSGLLSSSLVHPREVFRGSIVATCANIILAHNHPSGNREPSKEDIAITEKLVSAGKIIDIKVFDHIIFCDDGFTSFVERRLI
ncbi:JAB domain-containing protein [bacterium]|nr:JAB domain-containing protein [bacterium]MBI9073754.1 JAB domain-containing protein [Melioribacteraceae bacterium]